LLKCRVKEGKWGAEGLKGGEKRGGGGLKGGEKGEGKGQRAGKGGGKGLKEQ